MLAVAASRAADLAAAGQTDNPFVAWDNLGLTATLGGTAVLPDGDRINAVVGTTWGFWRPDVSGTEAVLQMQLPAPASCAFAGIVAHNLGTLGATVRWERSVTSGASWLDGGAGTIAPADDRALGWRMAPSGNDADYWRLRITGLTPGAPVAVGVAFLGQDMVFPSRVYQGVRPPIEPTRLDGEVNISGGGHFMGSDADLIGGGFEMTLEHLPDSFLRAAAARSFVRSWNANRPAFVHWRPGKYPGDLIYGWREGAPIDADNAGPKAYMSIKLGMAYYAG